MLNVRPLVPTALSLIRVVLSLALPFLPQNTWLWLIVCAGISDVADGWLARRWNAETLVGGLIDAIADKLFVLVVIVALAVTGKLPVHWIPLILARDLVVTTSSLYIFIFSVRLPYEQMTVHAAGKLATGAQFLLFLILLAFPGGSGTALVLASVCSLWAAFEYGRVFFLFLSKKKEIERDEG